MCCVLEEGKKVTYGVKKKKRQYYLHDSCLPYVVVAAAVGLFNYSFHMSLRYIICVLLLEEILFFFFFDSTVTFSVLCKKLCCV